LLKAKLKHFLELLQKAAHPERVTSLALLESSYDIGLFLSYPTKPQEDAAAGEELVVEVFGIALLGSSIWKVKAVAVMGPLLFA